MIFERRRFLARGTLMFPLGAGALVAPAALAQALLDLDVPFVVTPDNVVLKMLDMAQVSSQDQVLDLGSGDGRIVVTAALRYGASARGVEVDPNLIERARTNALKAGVAERVRFDRQDLFDTDLTQATVITMYLLPDVNIQLRPLLLRLRPGTRIVSHDWDMGDWIADQQHTVDAPDKKIGLLKIAKLMLWIVPANLDGTHRGDGIELTIGQTYQRITAVSAHLGDRPLSLVNTTVLGPSIALHGKDPDGNTVLLSTRVERQPAPGTAIAWRLRLPGSPERMVTTRQSR